MTYSMLLKHPSDMKNKFFISLGVAIVASCLIALSISLGGRYMTENVILPRVIQRTGADIHWGSVSSSFGSIRLDQVRVRLPDVPDLNLVFDSISVRYSLLAALGGDVEILSVEFREPHASFHSPDRNDIENIKNFLSRMTHRRLSDENTTSDDSPSSTPSLSVVDGRCSISSFLNADFEIQDIDLQLEPSGRFLINAQHLNVEDRDSQAVILSIQTIIADGRREPGMRVAINEISIEGFRAEATPQDDQDRLVQLARDLRAQTRVLEEDDQENAEASGAQDQNDLGVHVTLPTTIEIVDANLTISLSLGEGDQHDVVLNELGGQVFLGRDDVPPDAELSGSVSPGQGRFGINLTINERNEPRARVDISGLHVGQVASGWSLSGIEFDREAELEADFSLIRQGDGTLIYDGDAVVTSLDIRGELIADETVEDVRVRASTSGAVDIEGRSVVVEDTRIWINGVEGRLHGRYSENEDQTIVDINASLPPINCGELLESTPVALREHLDELDLDGVISGRFRLAYDTEQLDDLILELELNNGCRAEGRRRLAIERIQGSFLHHVDLPDDDEYEFRTGPGSGSWASLDQISPYMIASVLTTEDGRFYRHEGFSLREIRRALIRDLRAGRPRFGASTITMQLARNLYLYRRRTLARKLQEAVLTWHLEQNLSKDEIMALYLNIIEFGPHIFGIRHATMHYFGRQPDDLSPREAMFLAKLLPSPVRGHEETWEEGEMSPRWRARVDRALRVMRDRRALTAEEYRSAVEDRIVFYQAGDPLPMHRRWIPRGPFLRRHGVISDEPPERWLEVDTEAHIPAPSDLFDDIGGF